MPQNVLRSMLRLGMIAAVLFGSISASNAGCTSRTFGPWTNYNCSDGSYGRTTRFGGGYATHQWTDGRQQQMQARQNYLAGRAIGRVIRRAWDNHKFRQLENDPSLQRQVPAHVWKLSRFIKDPEERARFIMQHMKRRTVPVAIHRKDPASRTSNAAPAASTLAAPRGKPVRLYNVINVRSDDVLNIRAAPGGDNAIVGALPHNAKGIRLKRCRRVRGYSRQWCSIKHGKAEGWVYTSYLKTIN